MQRVYDRCPNCFQYYDGTTKHCNHCGFDMQSYDQPSNCLVPFTILQGKYIIGRPIELDGFGVTYIGWDMNLATYISVKEYYPDNVAYRNQESNPGYNQVTALPGKQDIYDEGLRIYVEEARNMSKFYDMQGLASVKNFFYENGTAYIVKEYGNAVFNNSVEANQTADSTTGTKAGKNKLLPIIIIGAVTAVVLIVLLLKVLVFDKSDGNNNTTETTTEATTAEAATEATTAVTTTEAATEAATTEEVVQFPGTWTDFKFMIDEDLYQMPMSYADWTAYGWKTDMSDVTLTPGEFRGIKFYNDNMECSAILINYSSEDAAFDKCYVIGFQFFMDVNNVVKGQNIIFPGDICINTGNEKRSSVYSDIEEQYGAPDDSYVSQWVSQYMYNMDDGSYIVFRTDENQSIYRVTCMGFSAPEGAEIQSGTEVETIPLNEKYETPSGTTDRFDDIFYIDGVNYRVPVPVSEFINNGWTIECEYAVLQASDGCLATLKKGNASIEVSLGNWTCYSIKVEQAMIYSMTFTAEGCADMDIMFPGGVRMGMNSDKFSGLYSDLEEPYYEYTQGANGFEQGICLNTFNGAINVEAASKASDTEEDVYYINWYYYEHNRSSAESDLSNVDYIQGRMVE